MSFVNTIVKRCTTKAVIVPVIIVPAHENTRIIAVLIRPLITLPCRNAVLKFESSTTLGSSNAPLVRKSSWLFSEPSNTTTRGTITIRQAITSTAYFNTSISILTPFGVCLNLYLSILKEVCPEFSVVVILSVIVTPTFLP